MRPFIASNNSVSLRLHLCAAAGEALFLFSVREFRLCTYRRRSVPAGFCASARSFCGTTSPTFMEVVRTAAKHSSSSHESIALRVDQKSYTYSQLVASASKVSSILSSLNLKSIEEKNKCKNSSSEINVCGGRGYLDGARIGIVAKPSAEFVAGVLGTWLGGGIAVPLALSYPEAELFHVMNDADISMILCTEEHQELMENVATTCGAQFSLIPTVPSFSSKSSMPKVDVEDIETASIPKGEDPALIVYTSGTTGKPKGVVHTHQSILAQVQILTEAWEYSAADQFLHCLPLHHILTMIFVLVVEFMPKFSVRGIWQRWRESYPTDGRKVEDAITVFTGVPTMYTRLLQGYETMDLEQQAHSASAARQLRLMMCGSSALPYPVMLQWESVTGHRLLERYGMTEFVMALSNPLRGVRKGGTVGKPLPGVQVKILSEEGSENDSMGVGELCVKSPSLFKEYWKQPAITKDSFVDGGFFKTGDTVRADEEGYYIILGRTSADIMKVGGYKLSALEIEAVLLEHPVVSECSVLGLPDKDYGEVVCAVIVPEENAKRQRTEGFKPALNLGELQEWAKEKLAPYKIPTRLFTWDSLPRNAMGKVNKKELKEMLVE
ncbi:hypothetical protein H6P81_000632 [Aristolochia fimbriata]|uniref:4-coumarate--CoA ligase n=1 Tax=Aristolochia fimbriata TaxID=158543 RepID=A0AAV7F629_ARIFI|nr:hypothetical protein H6P81_000632 [Aristolochia fimbriata]